MDGEDGGLSSYGFPYMTPIRKVNDSNQFNYANSSVDDAIKSQMGKMAIDEANNAARIAAENAGSKSWYSDLGNPFEGLGAKFSDWFTPQGASGTSFGGGLISGLGTLTGIGTGLAGMKLAKEESKFKRDMAEKSYARQTKMDKLQIDAYNRAVQRENEGEARGSKFAENAGNGAFYK